MTTKLCAGRCGQVKDEEEFDWNRSGYSRKNRCRDCFRADARDRTANHRKAKRPADWQPKYKKVECLGSSHACNKCGNIKDHSDFYEDKSATCNYESSCKECRGVDRKERWKNNLNGHRDKDGARKAEWTPERRIEWLHGQFVYKLNRDFHITEDQYNWLLEQQSGVCFLCKEPETRVHHRNGEVMRLAIDHDHRCCTESAKSCGKCIRSLLCYSCNMLMGKVELKPALAERFKDYIDRRPLQDIPLEEEIRGYFNEPPPEPLRPIRPSVNNRIAVRMFNPPEDSNGR